jgi:futalosine hydrolase
MVPSSVGCDLLVVAAFLPELAAFRAALGGEPRGRIGTVEVQTAPVGVGLVRAGCGTVTAIEAARPRAVVLIGTCGAYPSSGLSVGDVVVASGARLLEPAVVEGRAAFPTVMDSHLRAHGVLTTALARTSASAPARVVEVMTTLAVTTEDDLALSLGKHGEVEHLEAFAVAAVCDARSVPFLAALGVANRVGRTGRAEWAANHETAGSAAAALVLQWVEQGSAKVAPPPCDSP